MSRLPLLARHFGFSVLALYVFPAGSLLVAPVIIHPTGYSAKHSVGARREITGGVNIAKNDGRRLCVEEMISHGPFPRGNAVEGQSRTNGGMVGTTFLLMSFHIPKIELGLPGVWIGTGTTDTKNNKLGSSLKTGNSSASVTIDSFDDAKGKGSVGRSADLNDTSHVSNVGARRTVNATGSINATLPQNNGDTDVHRSKAVTARRVRKRADLTAVSVSNGDSRTVTPGKKHLKKVATRRLNGGERPGTSKRKPLVVTEGSDLQELTALVKDVLDRVGETERELRRLRNEGVVVPKDRSVARERKFVIDTRAKMLGAAFAGSLAGMILGWSILPNLWLLGAVAGAVACAALSQTAGTVGGICSTAGIQVALIYKDLRDWWEQTAFLYKTGKLSYTYWRVFEKYDQAWGLTVKYNEGVRRLSKEAMELDRQYKIRSKTLSASREVLKVTREIGISAVKDVTQAAGAVSGWGVNQLQDWGLVTEEAPGQKEKTDRWWKSVMPNSRGREAGVSGARRPLGISIDLAELFGGSNTSLYSAPAAGRMRKPGYRGDPVIPARIRHLLMTPKQVRDERLRKYRVGFMGMRTPRSFEDDD